MENLKNLTEISYRHCSWIGISTVCVPARRAHIIVVLLTAHPADRPQAVRNQLAVACDASQEPEPEEPEEDEKWM